MLRRAPWIAACLFLAGCASTRMENFPLPDNHVNVERRAIDVSHADRPLILVAISGGGSRAAALGWAVLKELDQFHYNSDGQSRSLTDDIAVVSTVSGGSVIGAHFALNGAKGLDRFAADFLDRDNMRTLGLNAANPFTWFQLMASGSARVDIVENLFDDQLFHRKTFVDLNQPGKPYLILNATDMASGEVFAFTPKRFDDICSDLDLQTISSAVGASSAVPIAVSPVAIENYSAKHCATTAIPQWITNRLEETSMAPYINLEQFKAARYANDLRHGSRSFRKIDYLYLLDGGLADNLAIHGLLETISSPYAAPVIAYRSGAIGNNETVIRAINMGHVMKVAVIIVNARADPGTDIYQSRDRPGIIDMIGSVVSLPIDSATSSVNSQMNELLAELNGAGGGGSGDPQFAGLRIYPIQIDFDLLRAHDQQDLQEKAKKIPTAWTISPENRVVVEQAGTALLHQHPCFQRMLLELEIKPGFVDSDFAIKGCPQAADLR